jgi:hypothetical protein
MLVKSWPAEPLIYAGLVAGLLLLRVAFKLQKRAKPQGRSRPQPAKAYR